MGETKDIPPFLKSDRPGKATLGESLFRQASELYLQRQLDVFRKTLAKGDSKQIQEAQNSFDHAYQEYLKAHGEDLPTQFFHKVLHNDPNGIQDDESGEILSLMKKRSKGKVVVVDDNTLADQVNSEPQPDTLKSLRDNEGNTQWEHVMNVPADISQKMQQLAEKLGIKYSILKSGQSYEDGGSSEVVPEEEERITLNFSGEDQIEKYFKDLDGNERSHSGE